MGKKSSYEQLLELKEKIGRLRIMGKDLIAELDDVSKALFDVTSMAAREAIVREAEEDPPVPKTQPPQVEDGRRNPSKEQYWDEKTGKWLDGKPDVAAGPDGEPELDIF